ncbi:hypothetical protein PG993_004635 [Apiospora rasikravindrae]|uniref:Uncharacterized protein n=1 Tax=Apiospora rasikravindrae TaxID=990691 RepID=A0ABR1TDB7_9PEZI
METTSSGKQIGATETNKDKWQLEILAVSQVDLGLLDNCRDGLAVHWGTHCASGMLRQLRKQVPPRVEDSKETLSDPESRGWTCVSSRGPRQIHTFALVSVIGYKDYQGPHVSSIRWMMRQAQMQDDRASSKPFKPRAPRIIKDGAQLETLEAYPGS